MFLHDWFTNNIPVWEQVVIPLLPHGRRRWLELGSHEGRSAEWTLDNALRPSDQLTCVDGWWDEAVERRFDENVGSRVEKVKSPIVKALLRFGAEGRTFDCIYLDADHDGAATLEAAVLAWTLLPPGGLLIFDDYRYVFPTVRSVGKVDTHLGIDAFMTAYCLRYDLLHRAYQIIVRKRLLRSA